MKVESVPRSGCRCDGAFSKPERGRLIDGYRYLSTVLLLCSRSDAITGYEYSIVRACA